MRRKYSFEDYQDFIQLAYREVPDICLGTDIIVGFPTEHQAEFEEGLSKSTKNAFALLPCFPFFAPKKSRAFLNLASIC